MPQCEVSGGWKRCRQFSPGRCDKRSFRTVTVGKGSVQMVICCPNGKWDAGKERCKVATRAQSVRRKV